MRFHYYPETDSLYIDLKERPSADSREVAPGVVADFDAEGKLVGIELEHASTVADLSRVEAVALPPKSCEQFLTSPPHPALTRALLESRDNRRNALREPIPTWNGIFLKEADR